VPRGKSRERAPQIEALTLEQKRCRREDKTEREREEEQRR
jgi:hypothetical protein